MNARSDGTGLRRGRRDKLEQLAQSLPLRPAVGMVALHELEASEARSSHECLDGALLSRRRSQCARRHADMRWWRRQRRQRRRGLHHLDCGGGTLIKHGHVALQRRRLEQALPRQPRGGVSPRRRAERRTRGGCEGREASDLHGADSAHEVGAAARRLRHQLVQPLRLKVLLDAPAKTSANTGG